MQSLLVCCIILAFLGISMSIYAVYVVYLNFELKATIKKQGNELVKKEEKINQVSITLKDQERFVALLRQQITMRDQEIKSLKRKPTLY